MDAAPCYDTAYKQQCSLTGPSGEYFSQVTGADGMLQCSCTGCRVAEQAAIASDSVKQLRTRFKF